MEISEIKKPNKYAALATYLIAVVCLILGLFLPLFNGKGILALQLPDALNALANKSIIKAKKPFTMPYPVNFFGGKTSVDIMALVVILYTVITALSLLALIPIGISTKKESKAACGCMYFIEVAAVVVLSVYLIIGLEYIGEAKLSYNMIIALCGSAVMLMALSVMCKRGTGVAKVVLFLLSAVALLMLFDWLAFGKFATPLNKIHEKLKIVPALTDSELSEHGYYGLQMLFETKFADVVKAIPVAKYKALIVLCSLAALLVVINYFIDAIALATNGKKAGHVFNLVRYGLEFAAVLCLLITALIVKAKVGLMLVVIIVAVLIQLIMSVVRFLIYRKRATNFEDALYSKPAKQPKQIPQETENYEQPLIAAPAYEQTVIDEVAAMPAVDVAPAQPEEEIIYENPNVFQTVIDDVVTPSYVKNEPVQPVRPIQPEPIVIDIVQPAPAAEEPVAEEPKPQYRHYEQPAPQSEYRRYEQPKPQPEYRRYEQPKPQPEYRRYEQPKPQPEYRRYEQPKPVQPEVPTPPPVRDEATRVYTINTIYGGPTDDFIKKLSNEEKIEFARTFIERSNGDIGNIPEYVIGGNNKKFFSSVFIYLGRIRGIISNSLLDKIYKELNMM